MTTTTHEKLEVGQGWVTTFGCDCGGDHTPTSEFLRITGFPDDRHATVVDDNGLEFDLYLDATGDVPAHWCYGTDGDPVEFLALVDTVSTVTHHDVELTVTRYPAGTYQAERAHVRPSAWNRRAEVSVDGPDTAFGKDRAARVNWSAIGSVDAADAVAYAAAISYAAELAPILLPAEAAR